MKRKYPVIIIVVILMIIGVLVTYSMQNVYVKDTRAMEFTFPHENARYSERIDQGDGTYRWADTFQRFYEESYEANAVLRGHLTKGKIEIEISNVNERTGVATDTQKFTVEAPATINIPVNVSRLAGKVSVDVYYDDEVEGSFTAEWEETCRRLKSWFSPTCR